MVFRKLLPYYAIILLLVLPISIFGFSRAKVAYGTAKLLIQKRSSSFTQLYTYNDKFSAVVKAVKENPDLPVYYLPTSSENKTAGSYWIKFQINYLLYPRQIPDSRVYSDPCTAKLCIADLKAISGIFISPYKQPELGSSHEQHPNNEYYLYIMKKP